MRLGEVLTGVRLTQTQESGNAVPFSELADREILGLEYDSRRVKEDFLFFAFPGSRTDGRQFALDALARGAAAVVSESPAPEQFEGAWVQVEHGRKALALAARNFYCRPDERLRLTGITGTNGKTTTSYLLDSIFRASGYTTGLIGTIEYHVAGRVLSAVNTTPESLDLVRLFVELERHG
ncbi:MAG: UDP-N-acetylmuramoyl-L-alanyl-D-glutamate--2,6-diaminopimelate ligase, partial [Acidobacteriia bacterium]|nr:UDP-N-acetylmuramoyl-L-alanyl-D-glutamate--2,6-diaminopimelate ligase [Terriglobia bacterium]